MSPAKAKRKSSTPAPRKGGGGGRTCAVPDCGRRVASDGLCEIHLPFLDSRGELGRRMKRWLAAAGVTPSTPSTEEPEKGTSPRKSAGRGGKAKAGGARASRKTATRKSSGKSARGNASVEEQPEEPETPDDSSAQGFQADDDQENTPTPTPGVDAAHDDAPFRDESPQEEAIDQDEQEEAPDAGDQQELDAGQADAPPNHAMGAQVPADSPALSTAPPVQQDKEEDAGELDDEEQDEDEDHQDPGGAAPDGQSDNDDEETPPT